MVPGVVLAAGARSGPASSGMPSGPSGWLAAGAVAEVAVVVVGEAAREAVRAVEVVLLWALPHPASTPAASRHSNAQTRRAGIAAPNGSEAGAVVSCARMSETAEMPMTTALEVPGMRIRENLGVCYGLVVRSMGVVGGVTASFKALRRGEISEYTQLLEDSRRHAIDRMVDNARLLGADAIVAVRFDSSEIGNQFTEIVAYGTAVKADRT